jgi:alkanesulfonate monooxygenase SsuD/methylene tetrahydromethanopterin reductase-like flavin-dependent oxidoreductase (luciferase family)
MHSLTADMRLLWLPASRAKHRRLLVGRPRRLSRFAVRHAVNVAMTTGQNRDDISRIVGVLRKVLDEAGRRPPNDWVALCTLVYVADELLHRGT